MASINGVKITSLKSFKDHEGAPCYQGNISYKNKKLGFWSQDAWNCVCDNFDFDESLLDKPSEDFRNGHPDDYMYKNVIEKESLLSSLVKLTRVEKSVKKQLKDDRWRAVVCIGNNAGCTTLLSVPDDATNDEILSKYKKDITDIERDLASSAFRYNDGRKSTFIQIYRSPSDFNLVIDQNHPVPDIFLAS